MGGNVAETGGARPNLGENEWRKTADSLRIAWRPAESKRGIETIRTVRLKSPRTVYNTNKNCLNAVHFSAAIGDSSRIPSRKSRLTRLWTSLWIALPPGRSANYRRHRRDTFAPQFTIRAAHPKGEPPNDPGIGISSPSFEQSTALAWQDAQEDWRHPMKPDAENKSDAEEAPKASAAPAPLKTEKRRTTERPPAAFTFKDWAQI